MLRRKKKMTEVEKMAIFMGDTMTNMVFEMIKYHIALNAITGHLLELDDMHIFLDRAGNRIGISLYEFVKTRAYNIRQVKISEIARIIEEEIENHARLIGKWNEEGYAELKMIKIDATKIEATLAKMRGGG